MSKNINATIDRIVARYDKVHAITMPDFMFLVNLARHPQSQAINAELLAALERMVYVFGGGTLHSNACERARIAIAKAKGRS